MADRAWCPALDRRFAFDQWARLTDNPEKTYTLKAKIKGTDVVLFVPCACHILQYVDWSVFFKNWTWLGGAGHDASRPMQISLAILWATCGAETVNFSGHLTGNCVLKLHW